MLNLGSSLSEAAKWISYGSYTKVLDEAILEPAY